MFVKEVLVRCKREENACMIFGAGTCMGCYLSFALRVSIDDLDKGGDLFVNQLVHFWIINDRLSKEARRTQEEASVKNLVQSVSQMVLGYVLEGKDYFESCHSSPNNQWMLTMVRSRISMSLGLMLAKTLWKRIVCRIARRASLRYDRSTVYGVSVEEAKVSMREGSYFFFLDDRFLPFPVATESKERIRCCVALLPTSSTGNMTGW